VRYERWKKTKKKKRQSDSELRALRKRLISLAPIAFSTLIPLCRTDAGPELAGELTAAWRCINWVLFSKIRKQKDQSVSISFERFFSENIYV